MTVTFRKTFDAGALPQVRSNSRGGSTFSRCPVLWPGWVCVAAEMLGRHATESAGLEVAAEGLGRSEGEASDLPSALSGRTVFSVLLCCRPGVER